MSEAILEVKNLSKSFPSGRKKLNAVNNVSFSLYSGETLGIVGESGCGKTTCGKLCMGMLKKDEGSVCFKGREIHQMSRRERLLLTRKMQMIFQDPYSSLDPHQKVYSIVAEGIKIHKLANNKKEEESQVLSLLEMVGLNPEHANRHVHEFSGGQRQRIGIARALSVNPELLFCDEPISALDVSIQAQIINLLIKLRKERNLTMFFISHDLSIVKYISDRIAVMYLGQIIEMSPASTLYENPLHPYTQTLLEAIPIADPLLAKQKNKENETELSGSEPDNKGCAFCNRCKHKKPICMEKKPLLKEIGSSHFVACHLHQ